MDPNLLNPLLYYFLSSKVPEIRTVHSHLRPASTVLYREGGGVRTIGERAIEQNRRIQKLTSSLSNQERL